MSNSDAKKLSRLLLVMGILNYFFPIVAMQFNWLGMLMIFIASYFIYFAGGLNAESNARLTGDARSASQPGGEESRDEPQK